IVNIEKGNIDKAGVHGNGEGCKEAVHKHHYNDCFYDWDKLDLRGQSTCSRRAKGIAASVY
ncbi:hypothetical protein M5X02_29225, partial [Paenibacillus alvei]